MKKFFRFDNEPITGGQYLTRLICGSWAIAFFGIGLWVLAATGYKRAGAFSWKKEFRILSAIFIPIHGLGSLISRSTGYYEHDINLADFFFAIGSLYHLVLLFKNGNKGSKVVE